MKTLTLPALLVLGLLTPGAAALAAAPSPAGPLDDFGCLVRTMYMADAADTVAKKATDAEARAETEKVATESWDAVSYFIGRLAMGPQIVNASARYDQIFTAIKALPAAQSTDEIHQCLERSRNERATYVKSLIGSKD